MHTQRWVDRIDNGLGYIPEMKFVRAALELDRPHGSGAIHLKPLSQAWSPWNTPGCTPRMTHYTERDVFEAYKQACREAADHGY